MSFSLNISFSTGESLFLGKPRLFSLSIKNVQNVSVYSFVSIMDENDHLRQALDENAALRQSLVEACNENDELLHKLKTAEEGAKHLETTKESLTKAENRIVQLTDIIRRQSNGEDVNRNGAVVTPGVSKKVLEGIVKENSRLKAALVHTHGKSGVELSAENRDLHNVIITLRDERDEGLEKIKALEETINAMSTEDERDATQQLFRLVHRTGDLERHLRCKQAYLDSITRKASERPVDYRELVDKARERDVFEHKLQKATKELADCVALVDQMKRDLSKCDEVAQELALAKVALKEYEEDFKKERDEKLALAKKMQQLKLDRDEKFGRFANVTQDRQECHRQVQRRPDMSARPVDYRQDIFHLECPTCKNMFPFALLEEHMRDCGC